MQGPDLRMESTSSYAKVTLVGAPPALHWFLDAGAEVNEKWKKFATLTPPRPKRNFFLPRGPHRWPSCGGVRTGTGTKRTNGRSRTS